MQPSFEDEPRCLAGAFGAAWDAGQTQYAGLMEELNRRAGRLQQLEQTLHERALDLEFRRIRIQELEEIVAAQELSLARLEEKVLRFEREFQGHPPAAPEPGPRLSAPRAELPLLIRIKERPPRPAA